MVSNNVESHGKRVLRRACLDQVGLWHVCRGFPLLIGVGELSPLWVVLFPGFGFWAVKESRK